MVLGFSVLTSDTYYPSVSDNFIIQSLSFLDFYENTFIYPAAAIALTILFATIIPWSIGERISYATTTIITINRWLRI